MTERALVHAHLEQCADCQAERAAIQLAVVSTPRVEPSRGAAIAEVAAQLVERARLVIARVAPSLVSLRSSALSAFRATAAAARGAATIGATRILALLIGLRGVVSTSLTGSTRAAVGAIQIAGGGLAHAAGLLPTLFLPPARAAADLTARVRFAGARAPRLLTGLGSASLSAGQATAHAAGEVGAAGATRIVSLLSALGSLAVVSSRASLGAAGRGIAAAGAASRRILDTFVRVGVQVPALVAPGARTAGRAVAMIPTRAWAYPRLCAGVASLVVLIGSLVVLGPPHWPDNREPLRDVRLPADRKPAEPAVVAPLVEAPPAPASAPQPVPAPRVAAPAVHAAIPAPVRRSAETVAPLPPSTEATRSADPSDPTAAIDWLLKGSGRRQTESP